MNKITPGSPFFINHQKSLKTFHKINNQTKVNEILTILLYNTLFSFPSMNYVHAYKFNRDESKYSSQGIQNQIIDIKTSEPKDNLNQFEYQTKLTSKWASKISIYDSSKETFFG